MVLFCAPCGVSVSSNSCFAWDGRSDIDHDDEEDGDVKRRSAFVIQVEGSS